jgi:hypothetical protein
MKTITNISVSQQALPILIREWEGFLPRVPGDVFALAYMSSFTNPDGTTVDGFRPGYSRHSVSPQGLGAMWARAQPRHAPEFLFMPKFIWSASEQYLIDVACLPYQLLSIGPANKL